MDAWEKFRKTIREDGLVKAGDRVLVAVSGGPDSVCLLHLFWRLRKTVPIEVHAVSFDHGLRKEAAHEVKMVERFGEKLGIPVAVRSLPVRAVARSKKLSVETAGRELRYRALSDLARKLKCGLIATGHTANDNAETVLLWLIRGTGSDGLAGIPLSRPAGPGLRLIRPILDVTRPEVMEYLRRQRLPYRVDASNYRLDYTRNRVRRRLVPVLAGYNPRIVEHLAGLARIVAREREVLDEMTARCIARSATIGANRISLDLKRFFRYNKGIQLRVLKRVLPERRSRSKIEGLLERMSPELSREIAFSHSWRAYTRNGRLVLRRNGAASDDD